MSAMHWEARRRQNALDRRLATKDKQCVTGDGRMQNTTEEGLTDMSVTPSALTDSSEPLVVDERILCHCQHVKKEQYNAKTENRYNSTQYSQQW